MAWIKRKIAAGQCQASNDNSRILLLFNWIRNVEVLIVRQKGNVTKQQQQHQRQRQRRRQTLQRNSMLLSMSLLQYCCCIAFALIEVN